jgi:ATP-dependent DNA ligase
VHVLRQVGCREFTLDGELILPIGEVLSFDALQARLHPAASRIERLSRETPAQIMLFDCLMVDGRDFLAEPLGERRLLLEAFHRDHGGPSILLSDRTLDIAVARSWLARGGGALDGVVAKRLDEPYRPGERAMLKVKQHRSADCVVGGFRRVKEGEGVASLLLGLYDDGRLNHVGFSSGIAAAERLEMLRRLEPLIEAPGFSGKTPGGPSRWNSGKENEWEPLRSELVVEVLYDQVTGDRFRHGTKLLRWRPDKAPNMCRMDQMMHAVRPAELATITAPRG